MSSNGLPPLPARDPRGHKGTFGTVVVVGGCADARSRMIGAPAMAALAALRSGAGLARMLCPEPIVNEAIQITPSATGIALATSADGSLVAHLAAEAFDRHTAGSHAIVVGPGLGWSSDPLDPLTRGTTALVMRAILHAEAPLVLDADALTALAATPDFTKDFRASAVLTPHPGEFKRLAAALMLPAPGEDDASRSAACEAMARRIGCIVVLKGAGTVVSDGMQTWRCASGHACLGTAGTGDVLSGLIAGLVAQYARGGVPLFDLARIGVEAHARCGELWASRHGAAGLVAHELADLIPETLEQMRPA
ncbi:MAG: NAD(P)H-hydrate dehydratase [Phycisphaerales bacterium]|nr:NAD(P)H-hydrate dehydratase [Planctomycetota bacterium]